MMTRRAFLHHATMASAAGALPFQYTELGNGTVDFSQIFPHAKLAGLQHYFVEQGGNFTHDPFRSIADGAEYMKRNPIRR
jgi:hypothetical protein